MRNFSLNASVLPILIVVLGAFQARANEFSFEANLNSAIRHRDETDSLRVNSAETSVARFSADRVFAREVHDFKIVGQNLTFSVSLMGKCSNFDLSVPAIEMIQNAPEEAFTQYAPMAQPLLGDQPVTRESIVTLANTLGRSMNLIDANGRAPVRIDQPLCRTRVLKVSVLLSPDFVVRLKSAGRQGSVMELKLSDQVAQELAARADGLLRGVDGAPAPGTVQTEVGALQGLDMSTFAGGALQRFYPEVVQGFYADMDTVTTPASSSVARFVKETLEYVLPLTSFSSAMPRVRGLDLPGEFREYLVSCLEDGRTLHATLMPEESAALD